MWAVIVRTCAQLVQALEDESWLVANPPVLPNHHVSFLRITGFMTVRDTRLCARQRDLHNGFASCGYRNERRLPAGFASPPYGRAIHYLGLSSPGHLSFNTGSGILFFPWSFDVVLRTQSQRIQSSLCQEWVVMDQHHILDTPLSTTRFISCETTSSLAMGLSIDHVDTSHSVGFRCPAHG